MIIYMVYFFIIMIKKNKPGAISTFWFVVMLMVSSISVALYTVWYNMLYLERQFFYSASAYAAAETGIEKWIYQLKINPDTDTFVWTREIVNKSKDNRSIEYRDQYFYSMEHFIEEDIPAWENIQLFFDNKIDARIKNFHIAYVRTDANLIPESQFYCWNPETNPSVEVWVFSSTKDLWWITETVLKSVNNRCESWFWFSSKGSSNTLTDPYSWTAGKITVSWGRCLLNSKWNVNGGSTVFENELGYTYNEGNGWTTSDNTCDLNYWLTSNDKFFATDEQIFAAIKWYQKWTTLVEWLDIATMLLEDSDKIVLEIRAIDDNARVLIWATDDDWNVYDIPWRYIHFTATGKAEWKDWTDNDVYRRIIVKKKLNKDLLPIFDYSLFSESEFIK